MVHIVSINHFYIKETIKNNITDEYPSTKRFKLGKNDSIPWRIDWGMHFLCWVVCYVTLTAFGMCEKLHSTFSLNWYILSRGVTYRCLIIRPSSLYILKLIMFLVGCVHRGLPHTNNLITATFGRWIYWKRCLSSTPSYLKICKSNKI